MARLKKKRLIPSIGEDMKHLEFSSVSVGM